MNASSLILSLCAALFFLSGCSNTPCERVCAQYNACTVDQRADDVDCATFCEREQQFEQSLSKAGADTCKKEFDAHISCWETNIGDICNAENKKCEASATAWTECMAKFCDVKANANDQACVPQADGGAGPALEGF